MFKRVSRAAKWLKRHVPNAKKETTDHGAIALTSALLLAVFAGSLGLGVDVANWYDSRLRLQTAADAAVRSAMLSKLRGSSTDDVLLAIVRAQAERNGFDSAKGTITIYNPPRPGEYADGVEVVLTQSVERQFTRIIRKDDILLEAVAIAVPITNPAPCITALNTTESKTIHVFGTANLDASGCQVTSNSSNPNAIAVQGSATLTSECVTSVGPIPSTAGMVLKCSSPREYSSPAIDPYQGTPLPSLAGPCLPSTTLQGYRGLADVGLPGKYCSGLSIKGLAVLLPGTYIIDGGTLSINGTASVVGLGITFVLINGADVQINGGADLTLRAPVTGTYNGMLFYVDPANGMLSHKINGSSTSTLDGALYFPNQDLEFMGGGNVAGACTMLIADTLSFGGNAEISTDCDHMNLPGGTSVRLAR